MDETNFQAKLRELLSELESRPASDKANAPRATVAKPATSQDLAAAARTLAETLDTLRLQVKYLVFDLEATRRENQYLRKMLESRPPHRDFDGGGEDRER